jgi:hypothetical protein
MDHTAFQAQVADYLSACAFETFIPIDATPQVQVFTIQTLRPLSLPVFEISQALALRLAEITEVSEGGSVQDLLVKNFSDKYLLIYEGTLLKGAKQNRVVNATLLLPPNSKHQIPASCVEQGRWHASSRCFEGSAYSAPQFLRKTIRSSISSSGSLKGTQGKVWNDIQEYACKSSVYNSSSDFEDIYHRSDKKASIFPQGLSLPPAAGIMLQVGGEWSLDFVANEAAFANLAPRLIPGYEFTPRESPAPAAGDPGQVLADRIRQGRCFTQPSIGGGTDVRIETGQGLISALVSGGEVVSLTMMPQ